MKVELLLADDTELRKAVKELIRAEVLSLVRSEVVGVLKEVVGDKVAGEEKVTKLMRDVIREEVKYALGPSDYSIRENAKQVSRELVRELLQTALNHVKVAELFNKE